MLRGKPCFEEKALKEALGALQGHHDAFRLRYVIRDGEVIQSHADGPAPLSFEAVDLRGADDAVARMEARADVVQGSLDLVKGPLFKAVLYWFEGAIGS